ncbi:hypothetical protein TcWFU_000956 [Taenia crassiceps]|uniref:Uncharacterized protein n=1 Tax=Taenia crassiceps TaxID=6207 RepID=A0ABR4Q8D6_9CEST
MASDTTAPPPSAHVAATHNTGDVTASPGPARTDRGWTVFLRYSSSTRSKLTPPRLSRDTALKPSKRASLIGSLSSASTPSDWSKRLGQSAEKEEEEEEAKAKKEPEEERERERERESMNGDQEPYQPLPFIPISMCTCNCTCKTTKSRKVKSVKRFDLASGASGEHSPATTTASSAINWHANGEQVTEKLEAFQPHPSIHPLIRPADSLTKESPPAHVEDAEIQTELVDLRSREKELNRLMQLLQNSRNVLHEQQQRLQSTAKRKNDQSQQTEPLPPCLFQAFNEVVTQQPLVAPPFAYSQSTTMPSTTSTAPIGLATTAATATLTATTLRERIQVSFGASQEKTNLISAAFIHRLKQRVQQRREEVTISEERHVSEDGLSSSGEEEEAGEAEGGERVEFQSARLFKSRRPREPSISRRAHLLPHHRGSLGSSSATSPKLTTSLAALSLRSSPPPPPAPPCTKRHHLPPPTPVLKALCQEADDLLALTPTTANLTPPPAAFTPSAGFKRRVIFADTTQVDGIVSPTRSQNRSPEEAEGVVKIKPAIKKVDVKDADAAVNGKRPMSQRSVAFVDEIDSKKLCNTDKEAGGKKIN